MNVQRSVPIPIRNGRKPHAYFSNSETPPSLASSGSLSPNLSAPSPPNFVPREPDAVSKVGRYLLLDETQLNVYKALDSVSQDELVCKVSWRHCSELDEIEKGAVQCKYGHKTSNAQSAAENFILKRNIMRFFHLHTWTDYCQYCT